MSQSKDKFMLKPFIYAVRYAAKVALQKFKEEYKSASFLSLE